MTNTIQLEQLISEVKEHGGGCVLPDTQALVHHISLPVEMFIFMVNVRVVRENAEAFVLHYG